MSDSPPPPVATATPSPVFTLTNGGRLRAMDNDALAAFLSNPPPLAVWQLWRDWLDAPAT